MSRWLLFALGGLVTALNIGVLILNLSSSSIAGVGGMDRQALLNDADFVQAVKAVVQSCRVNADTESIKC